jgi:hypothetical protein
MSLAHSPRIVTDGLVMCLDAANQKSFSSNTFSKALDIFDWYTTKRGNLTGNACTVERDFVTSRSPVGGIPLKMNVTGNDPHLASSNAATWNISAALNGQTWRISVYAKASQPLNDCELYLFGATSAGVAAIPGGGWYGIAQKTIAVTTEWQRFDHFITFNNAEIAFIQMRLDGPNSGGTGTTVWWDGLQVELGELTSFSPAYNENRLNWYDLKQQNNNGLLNGYPAFTTTSLGAIVFDGVNDNVNCGNAADINFGTGDFTVSLWFRRFTNATTNLRLLSKAAGDDTANAASAGFCFFGNNAGISFAVNPTAARTIINAASYSLNEWVNVVGLVERGVSMRSYKNGNLTASTTAPVGSVSGTTSLFVGDNVGSNLRWQGEIALVQLHNRALSDLEIQQNFNAIRGRYGI